MFHKLIEDYLTPDECNFIINMGKSIGLHKMTSAKFVNGIYAETSLNEDTNKRKGCYFVENDLNKPQIKIISERIVKTLNDLKIFNGLVYHTIPKYSFNEYTEDDFLDWHSDSHEILYGASTTVIFQLNDEYEDGEIKYLIEGIEYSVPKKCGSIFIFDSNIPHSVDKIKSGIRYSLNVWPSSKKKTNLL
jgi:predicted 2-oxoglutarate/Fe(II)-dependent dioxygenase YbiX